MKERGNILIVEDEDQIRLTLRDYLTKKGYSVILASDGVGALKQILDNDIDIIVTDYRMDILGGEYWIKFLKKFCPDKDIVITTGFLRPDFYIPFDVFYKPFDYGDLEKYIAKKFQEKEGVEGSGS
jgi:DNA-binding NtrC family response regulator